MNVVPQTKKRVVIVDDSRTMQAILENAFSDRPDFNVVGVAGDARSGADMITLLRPDIATIDLCMPYIDGVALLELLGQPASTCAITVSDMTERNALLTTKLQKSGASACLSKRELAETPESFFDKVASAYATFEVTRRCQTAAMGSDSKPNKAATVSVETMPVHFGYPVPLDEERRLDLLGRTQLGNAERERQFDLVTKHLAATTAFPVCLLTFIDKDTQWIKSGEGIELESTPREQAFCNYTISQGGAFVVANATEDSRFAANPLVAGDPQIRSYVGHPVIASDGTRIGALCLIDVKPRTVSNGALRQLAGMAEIVSAMIEQRPVPAM